MSDVTLSERLVAKAEWLLTDGRVQVRFYPTGLVAKVQGEHGEYSITRGVGGRFWCSCQARTECSHLAAIALLWGGES